MVTLTVDDNRAVTDAVRNILLKLDPMGEHLTAPSGDAALEIARKAHVDVAFLDIEMPERNGLDTARDLQKLQPMSNVVFITGHSEYALEAFGVRASDYLLKPITEKGVQRALKNLRHTSAMLGGKRLRVQCFGNFEVWCDGEILHFSRSRTKMLFAYLIDRRGAMCDTQQMICALWPEGDAASYAGQLRVFIADLQTTFTKRNLGDVLVRDRGMVGVRTELIDCDYYDYLKGARPALNRFSGEYMSQYSFGEVTLASLQRELYKKG